jgi:hypothetical protein
VAKAKGALDSVKAGLGGLASRLPFVKRPVSASPEPFSTIEDETPLSDMALSSNAAPAGAASKEGFERADFQSLLASILGRKPILIGLLGALAFILILIVVAVAVNLPPAAPKAAAPFTKEGEALVKTWLLPPGGPLEPRVEMQRSGTPVYTAKDAARLGLPEGDEAQKRLAEKNDEAMRKLYGTVP